jgi:glycosyltransferase involved in cell wall biosynthesis
LLESAGVDVRQVIFDNAELRESESIVGDLRLASSAIWSRSAKRRVGEALDVHRSQVLHVHNPFAAPAPCTSAAAAARGRPVVQPLHNYRFVCPVATTFRDDHACVDCVGRPVPWPGVVHACVRGSRAQSLVVAATLTVHRARQTFAREIGVYLALTEFQRRVMIAGGLPAHRIRVLPNFLDGGPGSRNEDRLGVTFAGRLAVEKGIEVLIDAASLAPGIVSVIGDGPLAPAAQEAHASGHIRYHGRLPRSTVVEEVGRSIALVMPSIWFEGFPLVVLEAYASGTPIIASRLGSLGELVKDGVTGLLIEPGNATRLADGMRWAVNHPEEMRSMGENAHRLYESRFGGEVHLTGLIAAYEAAMAGVHLSQ